MAKTPAFLFLKKQGVSNEKDKHFQTGWDYRRCCDNRVFNGGDEENEPSLDGTWVGEGAYSYTSSDNTTTTTPYGTLVIDGEAWNSVYENTTASKIVDVINEFQTTEGAECIIGGGEIKGKRTDGKVTTFYKYKVEDNTLTIISGSGDFEKPYFQGTKQ